MKKAKKLASLLLALVMVLSMTTTAFAESHTLTIKTTKDHTYKVYQLLTGDVSDLVNGSGTLANVALGENVKSGTTVDTLVNTLKGESGADLGDVAYEYIDTATTPKLTVEGTGEDVAKTIPDGYYVVVDSYTGADVTDGSDTVSRYMVAVSGPTTITPKTSTPNIDKKIIDTDSNKPLDTENAKTDTASIGDVINYEITGVVPDTQGYKYYYYVVNDKMSEGLTLDQNSFVVVIGDKTLVKGTDYYVYYDEDTNSFQLALEDLKKLVDTENNDVVVGSNISIKYDATVNDNAEIGKDPNTNTANLQYSNNPSTSTRKDKDGKPGTPDPGTATGEGPDKVTNTYVTELTILKVDQDGKKLSGVEFTLSGNNLNKVIVETNTTFRAAEAGETGEYYKLKNGTYTKTAPSDAAEGQAGYNKDKYENPDKPTYIRVTSVTTSTAATAEGETMKIVGTVNDEGYLTFTGLNAGTYTLTESKTPGDYSTIEPITFVISAACTDSTPAAGGKVTWTSSDPAIHLDAANNVFDSEIINTLKSNLPATGGIGTTIFYVVGSILIVAAGVMLITRKRMNNEE